MQVTVATTTCASRVSALVGHRKRPPVQVTVAPAPFAPPHVPESKCAQWLKKKTTSASYSWSEPAPPPLECTLQQANVTCLHHHHSGSCNEHTSIILCARAARKQTTTSGTATTYYYHHHHTVQVRILRPPHAFLDENDHHHHHHMVPVQCMHSVYVPLL